MSYFDFLQGWLYFFNGDRLYADYLNGRANGEGRLYFIEGDVFFGHFIDNWRHGDCLYIEASGVRSVFCSLELASYPQTVAYDIICK